ncbi:MAG TPA: cupin domain-containing protein [Gammaproteobacteria bacterium]|nr:cupin domain-containing protein [Gammaproteobacteria bacterium]
MNQTVKKLTRQCALLVLIAGAAWAAGYRHARGQTPAGQAKPLFSAPLPNVPGKRITAVVVDYAPGGESAKHHHAGSVLAYVVSGTIRSQNSVTGPVRDYRAGEAFFEPPGSVHLVSENASATEPARLLAIFVADDGARLTMPGDSE